MITCRLLAVLLSATLACLGLVRVSGECSSGWGKEPKYDDSSCKSYWYCEDYYGRVEHCPHGYQFHYEYKDCLKDEDVLCKWQLSSYHSSYSSSGSDSSWGSSHGSWSKECHEEHGKEPDYESEHCETYYSCHDHHGSLEHCPHGHQFDFHDKECHEDKYVYCQDQRKSYSGHDSHSEHGHHDSGHSSAMSSYECHEEHGKEPDYESEHCETYYSCHDHHGSLEHCPHGHQFDFHDKECHEDKYVYCQEQRKSYSGHDSHDDSHHHSSSGSSSGVGDSLYYMMAMNGLGGLEGGANGESGGQNGVGGLLGGLGGPAAAAAVLNARALNVQGNAGALPIQGNALQGVPLPNQVGFPPNQVANLPNQIGFPPNQVANLPNQFGILPNQFGFLPNQAGNLPNQFGVQPNQLAGLGQVLPGLGLAANPFNLGGANVNQIQVAGAAAAAKGLAANQDQSVHLDSSGLNAKVAAPVGQTAVDQGQKIVINLENDVPTASGSPAVQPRLATGVDNQPAGANNQLTGTDNQSAPVGGPFLIPSFPAVQVLATRPATASGFVLTPPAGVEANARAQAPGNAQVQAQAPGNAQVQAQAPGNAQVQAQAPGNAQVQAQGDAQVQAEATASGQARALAGIEVVAGGAPVITADPTRWQDVTLPPQLLRPVVERVPTPFWWLEGGHATLPPLSSADSPWFVPDKSALPWVPVELQNSQTN